MSVRVQAIAKGRGALRDAELAEPARAAARSSNTRRSGGRVRAVHREAAWLSSCYPPLPCRAARLSFRGTSLPCKTDTPRSGARGEHKDRGRGRGEGCDSRSPVAATRCRGVGPAAPGARPQSSGTSEVASSVQAPGGVGSRQLVQGKALGSWVDQLHGRPVRDLKARS